MKINLLFGILFLASCTPKHDEVRIEGQLKNIDDGIVVQLFSTEGNVGKCFMTDTIKDGKFSFVYTPEDNELKTVDVMLRSNKFPPMSLQLWVRKGSDTEIYGDNPYIYSWNVESNVDEQRFRQKLIKSSLKEWEDFQRLSIERIKCYMAYRSGNDAKFKTKADSLSNVCDEITLGIYKNNARIMLDSDINEAWMHELGNLARMLKFKKDAPIRTELQQLYDMLDEEQKKSDAGRVAYLALNPPVVAKVGDIAPDGDIYDLEGNIHHISDLKGKFVLLDFWSDGCGPCIMAQPELKAISEKFKDKLEVVSLNIQDRKGWENVSKKHTITWHNWNDLQGNNGLSALYGVKGIPYFVMISPEGKILDIWSGYGKDYLTIKVKTIIENKRPPMTIRKKNGNKIIDFPRIKSSEYDVISIQQIELAEKATILKVHATYIPNYWIMLDKNTSLTSDTGVKCKLLKADGFKIGEKVFMPESGTMDFTLYFEPLPEDAKSFDFSEGEDVEGGYEIKGISLY